MVFNAAFCAAVVGEAEAVGENLIHNALGKPLWGLKATLKNREPEALGCTIAYNGKMSVISRTKPFFAAFGVELEAIPKCRRFLRRKAAPKTITLTEHINFRIILIGVHA